MDKPNVEKLVIAWLDAQTDWDVYGDRPKTDLPERFILVDRTGGAREAMVLDTAEILIEDVQETKTKRNKKETPDE